jgi:hypothetical protein
LSARHKDVKSQIFAAIIKGKINAGLNFMSVYGQIDPNILYPDSNGKLIADNTEPTIYRPDGQRFLNAIELNQRAEAAELLLEQER